MIDHRAHHDALSRAIFKALEAARAVAEAFGQVEANGGLDWEIQETTCDLLRGKMEADSFSDCVVLHLRRLAESIELAIAAETRTSIHFDECCTSGAWEETHLTERGYALDRLHRASNVLADRITTVVDMKRTEFLTLALSE